MTDRTFTTRQQLSDETGLSPSTLGLLEQLGLIPSAARFGSQRLYDRRAIRRALGATDLVARARAQLDEALSELTPTTVAAAA